jgi:hypothetical protein
MRYLTTRDLIRLYNAVLLLRTEGLVTERQAERIRKKILKMKG